MKKEEEIKVEKHIFTHLLITRCLVQTWQSEFISHGDRSFRNYCKKNYKIVIDLHSVQFNYA